MKQFSILLLLLCLHTIVLESKIIQIGLENNVAATEENLLIKDRNNFHQLKATGIFLCLVAILLIICLKERIKNIFH